MLFCQYVYYQHINPPRSRSRLTRRMSVDRPSPRYRTLSAVASHVAATAALAAEHDEHVAPHSSRRTNRWPQSSRETFFDATASRAMSREDAADIDDVDEGAFSTLADSFHSEGGQTIGNKQVSWNTEPGRKRGNSVGGYTTLTRSGVLPPSASYMENSVSSLARGRSLQRDSEHTHLGVQPSVPRSSRISKQGASMMFLGLFALFGIGRGSFGSNHMPMLAVTGRVLAPRAMNSVETLPMTSDISVSPENTFGYTLISIPAADFEPQVVDSHDQELIIGHIFAWVCTTLYLTSRLPQIWKNVSVFLIFSCSSFTHILCSSTFYQYARKSVEVCFPMQNSSLPLVMLSACLPGTINVSLCLCIPRKRLLCRLHPHLAGSIPASTGF